MKPVKPLIVFLCISLCTYARAENGLSDKYWYIGIDKNRAPYAYLNEQQQAQGFLVALIKSLCHSAGVNCNFVGGILNDSLQALQNVKLDAILLIDPALPPEVNSLNLTHPPNIDNLKLIGPLCHLTPAVLQKKANAHRNRPEDFNNLTIGVQEGSVLHKYLQDNYSKHAHIRAYPQVEAAVLDLTFDRIDAVFANKAFLNARVMQTALGEYANLTMTDLPNIQLAATTMVLAVRERDKELIKQLTEALRTIDTYKTCAELQVDLAKTSKNQ